MSTGQIIEVIGAVVDVEFPSSGIPKVYDALKVDEQDLTLEVQQQLGDGIVRTIAMGASEGLQRGLQVTNTGAAINVPVGPKTPGPRHGCAGPAGGQRRRGGQRVNHADPPRATGI